MKRLVTQKKKNPGAYPRLYVRSFVDYDIDVDDDSLPEASDTLVFMVVSLNSNWKVPCGYFLVNGLTGEEKANLNIVKLNIEL